MKFTSIYAAALGIFLLLAAPIARAEKGQAQSCSLPKGESLTVGCTYHCSRWMRWGLKRYAKKLGYKLNIKNLYSPNSSVDLSQVDAVLIPGGADINPKYYTPHVEPELQKKFKELDFLVDYNYEGRKRDPFEHSLLEQYFQDKSTADTPVLGVCRGMQMLAVSQGIPLYIDIKKELDIRNRRWTIDRIHVTKPNSVIHTSVDKARFWGVEYHHQGLRLDYFTKHKDRWPNVEVTAVSNGDKIAEALEFSDRPVLGVQFHPEWTFGKVRRGVFSWLLTKACQKKNLESKK